VELSMKLAVITNILAPYRIPLFQALRTRVDALTVLLMASTEENRDWRLPTHDLGARVLPGIHVRPPGRSVALHVNHGVGRALRRARPDVVLSGGFAPANVAALLYCRLHGIPFVCWGEITLRDPQGWARGRLRRVVVRASSAAIASSTESRDAFVHYGAPRDRVFVSTLPIDVTGLAARVEALRAAPEYDALVTRYRRPVLLHVGQLIDAKGIPELLAAYARLLARGVEPSLVFVGDGPQRAAYDAEVRRRGWRHVEFVGYVQQGELHRWYAIADAFVFPTRHDKFGVVLSEAMAAGVPALASIHAAATADLIEHGVTGFRIDPADPAAIADLLHQVLFMDGSTRRRIGAAARRAVAQFDVQPVADQMIAHLQKLY